MILGLDAYATDWLDLVFRWLHVISAIVWIGTSFYFVALDNHLLPPKDEADRDRGVGGETWEIHGGGFYRIEKYRVAPPALPEPLHWFKWEAYWTWLSGFALLVVLYYANASTYLIDRSVADLHTWEAILLSVGGLALAWLVYDGLCRFVRSDLVLGAAILGLVLLAAWGSGELFSPHAAWLQVGAMLGTVMAANVLFNIIPAHWELIRAKEAGREPDASPGLEAKRRSVHNNYLTLPVLVAMLSGHFAFLYTHSYAWLLLVGVMAIGAWIRVYFNLRHRGRTVWWIPVTAAAALAAIAVAVRPTDGGGASAGPEVPFAAARAIVQQRCVPCHSMHPSYSGITAPPLGVAFDTPEEMHARAEQIRQQAVDTHAMPLGNVTRMTQAERDRLGAWIRQGAKIP